MKVFAKKNAGNIDPAELLAGAYVVKDSRSTTAGVADGLFIKRYNRRGFFHTFKRFFQIPRPCRCRKAAVRLARHGIPTPEVVAIDRHFLVTKAVDGIFCSSRLPSVELLAGTLRAMHDAGVYHGDTSIRNFYFVQDSDLLGVIDLDGAAVYRRIPRRKAWKDIARALSSYMLASQKKNYPELIPDEAALFLQLYYRGDFSGQIPQYILKRTKYLLTRTRQ